MTAIHPISGAEITQSEETGKTTVTMALLKMSAADDMFYALAQTLKTELRLKRRHILRICIRALIFND